MNRDEKRVAPPRREWEREIIADAEFKYFEFMALDLIALFSRRNLPILVMPGDSGSTRLLLVI